MGSKVLEGTETGNTTGDVDINMLEGTWAAKCWRGQRQENAKGDVDSNMLEGI